MSTFLLLAKAGGSGEAPENTCEAIQRAARLEPRAGVEIGIEVDLRSSADGRLVALHDAHLERTTDGQGPVRRQALSDLRRLRAGKNGERIPSLADVLDAAGTRPLLLDLHDGDVGTAQALCRELSKTRSEIRDRLWVASEHGRVIRALRSLDPRLRTAATPREAWAKLLLGRARLGRFAPRGHVWIVPELHAGVRVITPRFVEEACAAGDPTWAFVVDDVARLARLRSWGVAGCITTRPGALAAALTP